MATIKQLDDQISKINVQKDALTMKANQIEQKIANLRKSLASATNNPKQADMINKQITQLQMQKRVLTGIDFDVNEEVQVVEEDGESISSGSYAGAEFPMPMGTKPKTMKVPLLSRNKKAQVNTYIDNLGGN